MTDYADQNQDQETTVRFTVSYRTLSSVCAGPGCSVIIEQPDRPGRKRLYHCDACRQRAYRARGKQPTEDDLRYIRHLQSM